MAAAREALSDVLGAQQGWAGRPSMMIAETATSVGRALGLPEGEIERIRTASLLHDLGKLAIPDEILSKPGELVEPEWRVVAEHPRVGQIVLEQAGALRDAAMIVLHHHEWYDGRGYPYGLAAHEIPVGARIVAIADAYEAMVAGRPYRPAISHQAALTELRRHAGVQFDPELVDVFTSLFADGVPWKPERAGHAHPHPHLEALPGIPDEAAAEALQNVRPVADIHDGLHARRRRAVLARRAPTAVELADAGGDRFGTHG
jgi:HD-GYP domain-containing protein (c-di-GMP phosphodiesterase class II)